MTMVNLSDRVAESLTRYNMLEPGDRVGVAVSAGADSVALLHILYALGRYQLTVLHLNHMLRGAESDADEIFVQELAAKLNLPFEAARTPLGAGNVEQEARNARRLFFAGVKLRLDLRRIALGHNQTDQAETVLYRFLRGSGLAGLAGMAPVTAEGFIRPLLNASREEVREWASSAGIHWREDSSNQNTEFVRNRLRLEFVNPQLVRVLAATAGAARDEESWWTARIGGIYAAMVRHGSLGDQLSVADLAALPAAEQRRVIRLAIQQVKGDLRSIDFAHVEAIRKLLGSEAGHDRVLIPGIDALRSFGTLLLAKPGTLRQMGRHYHLTAEIDCELALPYGAGRLYVNRVTPETTFYGNFGEEAQGNQEVADLDGEILGGGPAAVALHVRNWEPGDEYCRTSHSNAEKIKSLFQQFRVLLWERRTWPVLMKGKEIAWSRLFGAAAKFQATRESRDIVRVRYVNGGSGVRPSAVLGESKDSC